MKMLSILLLAVLWAGSAQAHTHTMVHWPICVAGPLCPHAMQVIPHDKAQNMMHYRVPMNHR